MSEKGIRVRIGGDASELKRAAQEAKASLGEVESASKRMADRIGAFGESMTALGKKMSIVSGGIAAAGAGLFMVAKGSADAGNQIDKASKAVGLSADAYQELGFALGQVSDLTQGQVDSALRQLNTRLGQAASGSKPMIEAFAAVGVSQEDIASGAVDAEAALTALIAASQSAPTAAEAAANAGRLLGEEAAKLGPIFRESGGDIDKLRERANELGIVLSGEAVASSAKFTDQMDELQRQFLAVRDTIGQALIPVLTETLIPAIQEKVIPAIQSIAGVIADVVQWFNDLPGPVQEVAGVIAGAFAVGGPVLLAIGALAKILAAVFVAATGPVGLAIAAAAALAAAWVAWGDDIKEAVGAALDWVAEKFRTVFGFIGDIQRQMYEAGVNIVSGLIQGLTEKWEELKERVLALTDLLPAWVRERLGIQSPSLVFYEIGQFIGEGLANGISDSAGLIRDAMGTLTDGAQAETEGAVQGILGSLGQLFGGSKKFAAAQALINTLVGATEALKLPFPANLAAYAKVLATGLSAVSAIKGASPGGSNAGPRGAGGAGGGNAAPPPVQTFQFTIQNDPLGFGERFARQIVDQINETSRNGGVIRGVIA